MPFAITLPDDDEADITRVCAREKGARLSHPFVFGKAIKGVRPKSSLPKVEDSSSLL